MGYRRTMALRPVHRIKHVVDSSATLAAGSQLNTTVLSSVDAPTLAGTAQVETGSKCYGLYIKVEVASNEVEDVGAIPNVYFGLFKSPGNAVTPPALNAVGASDDKRWMLHQEMIMIENSKGGNPRVLFNGVVKIPKGMSRMAINDSLFLCILSPAIDIALCFQCHYKEFR